jgi:protein-S-isoprenylcysteine O-methyltransferase Ste14
MKPDNAARLQFAMIQAIMVGLLVWGGYLALGAVQAGGRHPALRGLIVLGCSVVFLGFWLAALWVRQRRLDREQKS